MKYILWNPNQRVFYAEKEKFEVTFLRDKAQEFDSVQAQEVVEEIGEEWYIIPNNLPRG